MNLLLEILLLFVTIIYSFMEVSVKLFIPVKRKFVSREIVLITGAVHGIGRLSLCIYQASKQIIVFMSHRNNKANCISTFTTLLPAGWNLLKESELELDDIFRMNSLNGRKNAVSIDPKRFVKLPNSTTWNRLFPYCLA